MRSLVVLISLIFASVSFSKEPAWLQDSKKGCKGNEICAVGSGESRNSAERNARVALSKVFNTKIDSKFQSSLQASGKDLDEQVSEDITEATESAIAGVEIQKRYEDKTTFYALASLNKSRTAAAFKKQIDEIDEKLKAISKSGEKFQKLKMEQLYVKREVLNNQYEFLTSRSLASPVSYEEIFNAKNSAAKDVVVHIFLTEEQPKATEGLLQELMSEMGFKVTSGKKVNSNATHILKGELSSSKEYMNVEGFEKHKFLLKLRGMKSGTKVETGHLNYEVIETGRSFSQAREEAHEKIKSYLKSNIDKLNLE